MQQHGSGKTDPEPITDSRVAGFSDLSSDGREWAANCGKTRVKDAKVKSARSRRYFSKKEKDSLRLSQ
jgi:hypothetical protein